jgi:aminopeptidase YwaD
MRPDLLVNLKSHLENLAYPRHALKHPEAHAKASRYVQETLLSYGYQVAADPISFESKTYCNWIATLPGDSQDLPLLIVGAHFDSVPESPGADDNASGVAVMLETARLYQDYRRSQPATPKFAVQFVGFDLEECVTMGSIGYAHRLQRENRSVYGMMSLEMVGYITSDPDAQKYPPGLSPFYPKTGDFVTLVGSIRSFGFLLNLRRAFKSIEGLKAESLLVPGKGRIIPNVRRSDHAPFWDAGFPAVMITDTSFYRNPHYHTPQDTIDKLDLPFMALIVQALMSLLTPT